MVESSPLPLRAGCASFCDDMSNPTKPRLRFAPSPNGYLHLGHAKSICLNFGVAAEFGGRCNLRFDDTNPTKEDVEYVDSIQEDVRWLGFQWSDKFYASDYFELLYRYAEQLIQDDKAYIDSLSADEIRQHRGTLTEAGRIALAHAERIFATGHELVEVLRTGSGEERQVLRIGAVATLSRNFQENWLRPALEDPAVMLSLESGTLEGLAARLKAHQLDVVLANEPVPTTVRDVGEQHILEDFGMRFIPTAQDYLQEMEIKPWMDNMGGVPRSFEKINKSKGPRKVLSLD